MARPGAEEIQLDLIGDYKNKSHQPPLLAVWGKHDPAFIPPGAFAYQRDIPSAEVHLLDTGHFALETHNAEIAAYIDEFLSRTLGHGRA